MKAPSDLRGLPRGPVGTDQLGLWGLVSPSIEGDQFPAPAPKERKTKAKTYECGVCGQRISSPIKVTVTCSGDPAKRRHRTVVMREVET